MSMMREYRVIHRHTDDIDRDGTLLPDSKFSAEISIVTSDDMAGAENQVLMRYPDHVVLAIELTRPSVSVDDATINRVLDDLIAEGDLDQYDIDTFDGYNGDVSDFICVVNNIAMNLPQHSQVEGLDIDFTCQPGEPIDYAILTRPGWGNNAQRRWGFELSDLTDDSSATGRDGYLAILRTLMNEYNALR